MGYNGKPYTIFFMNVVDLMGIGIREEIL